MAKIKIRDLDKNPLYIISEGHQLLIMNTELIHSFEICMKCRYKDKSLNSSTHNIKTKS